MFASSQDAEDAFYDAFGNASLEQMMQVWAVSFDVVCVHPGGPRHEGIEEVRRSWAAILAEDTARRFELRGLIVSGTDDMRIHTLEENSSVPGTSLVAPPVLATNIYQRFSDGWRIVLHHASVSPAAVAVANNPPADSTPPTTLH